MGEIYSFQSAKLLREQREAQEQPTRLQIAMEQCGISVAIATPANPKNIRRITIGTASLMND